MFELAIKELEASGNLIGKPESFNDYKRRAGITQQNIRTAHYLSIYSIEGLQPELQKANCCVFRLGAPSGERLHTSPLLRLEVIGLTTF